MSKELCNCGSVAIWCYMPGYSNSANPHYCDKCVPRGCDCGHEYVNSESYHPALEGKNLPDSDSEEGVDWKWIEPYKVWCYLDEEGREYPCCEFLYDEDGWEIEE